MTNLPDTQVDKRIKVAMIDKALEKARDSYSSCNCDWGLGLTFFQIACMKKYELRIKAEEAVMKRNSIIDPDAYEEL